MNPFALFDFLRAARNQRSDTKNYLSCLPRTVKRTNYQTVWNDSERWQTCCNALKFIKINRRYHPLQICLTSGFFLFFGMSLIHNIYQLYKIARFSSFFLKRDLDLWNYRRDVAFNLNYNSMHVSRQFNILQINIDKLSLKHQTILHGTKKTQFSTQKVCIDLNNIIFSVIIAIRSSSSRHFEMIWPAGRASTCLFYGGESFTRY